MDFICHKSIQHLVVTEENVPFLDGIRVVEGKQYIDSKCRKLFRIWQTQSKFTQEESDFFWVDVKNDSSANVHDERNTIKQHYTAEATIFSIIFKLILMVYDHIKACVFSICHTPYCFSCFLTGRTN